MKEVGLFLVLLAIVMFIFALLGMELYGHKIRFADDNTMLEGLPEEIQLAPRPNFDSFYMAITSIFIVFIGEEWQELMHSHFRVSGNSALFFFPALYICLNLIMLNLFLAILLQDFEITNNDEEDDTPKMTWGRVKRKCKRVLRKCLCRKKEKVSGDDEVDITSSSDDEYLNTIEKTKAAKE